MFSKLKDMIFGPQNPSVLLVVGKFDYEINVLHVFPETGEIERFYIFAPSPTFRLNGSRERSREQIGTITLPKKPGTIGKAFLDEVKIHVQKRWDPTLATSPSTFESAIGLAQTVLQPAVLDVLPEWEKENTAVEGTETLPISLVYITRPGPGRVMSLNPTSISN